MRSQLNVALLVMVLASSALQAAEPRILFAPPRVLEAGEVVTVGWEGIPAGVEELEFLLGRENGEVVRLTPQLMPSSGSFRWTVPNLPSRAAVLELRAGLDDGEITIASSEPFGIRGAAGEPRLEFHDGEWWAFAMRIPAGDVQHLQCVPAARATPIFLPSRQLLLSVRMETGDEQPVDVRDVTSLRVDTRCGAPRIIPQRK